LPILPPHLWLLSARQPRLLLTALLSAFFTIAMLPQPEAVTTYAKSHISAKIKAEHRIKESQWRARYQSINKAIRTTNPDVVFLGDSITHGWKYTNTWQQAFGKYRPVNAGIASDRVQHLLWRVENGNFSRIQPKVAVILVGVNNLALNTPEEVRAGISQIITAVHKRSPQTRVLVHGLFPSGKQPWHKRRKRIKLINQQLQTLASKPRVEYIDIGQRFLDKRGYLSKSIMYDYLHLTHKCYRIWANALAPKLHQLTVTH
jgi:lysophospholipase L1-like esterase